MLGIQVARRTVTSGVMLMTLVWNILLSSWWEGLRHPIDHERIRLARWWSLAQVGRQDSLVKCRIIAVIVKYMAREATEQATSRGGIHIWGPRSTGLRGRIVFQYAERCGRGGGPRWLMRLHEILLIFLLRPCRVFHRARLGDYLLRWIVDLLRSLNQVLLVWSLRLSNFFLLLGAVLLAARDLSAQQFRLRLGVVPHCIILLWLIVSV